GIGVSCKGRDYARLEDVRGLTNAQRQRALNALLNARILMGAVNETLTLAGAARSDADDVVIEIPPGLSLSIGDEVTGARLLTWGQDVEQRIHTALDSYLPPDSQSLPGEEQLDALEVVAAPNLRFRGEAIAEKTFVLFDDFHHFTPNQRRMLIADMLEIRRPVGVWVAERLEALQVDEMLSEGVRMGRDLGMVVELEVAWRDSGSKLHSFMSDVADRRVKVADVDLESIDTALRDPQEHRPPDEEMRDLLRAIDGVSARTRELAASKPGYETWLTDPSLNTGSPRDRAIAWRRMEILILRREGQAQKQFEFPEQPVTIDELEGRDVPAIREAAELFMCREFGLPYYAGMKRITCMTSGNVEQFLDIAGDMFEEIAASVIMGRPPDLPAQRQHQLAKAWAKRQWDSIPACVPHGRGVQHLLRAIGQVCDDETMRPSAPYAPGVTGIGLSIGDWQRLCAAGEVGAQADLRRLAQTLSSCVAQNLLERREVQQGRKDERKVVLYLNRWLCVHFSLPLGYGGWRLRHVNELTRWADGRMPEKTNGGLFE
ncbi:MAG: hypothetical protein GX600_06990, partial [Dehalococcoidia bacterium]|nr:hypothetical protein [Dehalococcoidia bacterium]